MVYLHLLPPFTLSLVGTAKCEQFTSLATDKLVPVVKVCVSIFGWCWCQAQLRSLRGSSSGPEQNGEVGVQCGKLKVSKKQISSENTSP